MKILVSFYNIHNKSMTVSGPNDPSASLFIMNGWLARVGILILIKMCPTAVRFMATIPSGEVLSSINVASMNSIINPAGTHLRPAFMDKVIKSAKPVNIFYFIQNFRKKG